MEVWLPRRSVKDSGGKILVDLWYLQKIWRNAICRGRRNSYHTHIPGLLYGLSDSVMSEFSRALCCHHYMFSSYSWPMLITSIILFRRVCILLFPFWSLLQASHIVTVVSIDYQFYSDVTYIVTLHIMMIYKFMKYSCKIRRSFTTCPRYRLEIYICVICLYI